VSLTVTFDLEDHRAAASQEERFSQMTHRFLDFAAARGIVATVFVVGDIARTHASLIRRVAADGHEIGLHGLHHQALVDVGAGRLGTQLRDGRSLLEDVAQAPVCGFRAPIFSLTPVTRWAVHEIADAGFAYSSSVLPARSPLHGWPGAPRQPFRWENGLIELPCPVGGIGRAAIPFLGGVYMRYLPAPATKWMLSRSRGVEALWTYLHPYDLDAGEPFFVLPHAGRVTSRILHARRGATLARLESLIAAADGVGRPLGEIARELEKRQVPEVSLA
jgi:polysaccharide deacetylase family protein (PEP-CTERM system associated)